MTLVDTHAHLDQDEFDTDRAAVIERANLAGLSAIVSVGVSALSSEATMRLAAKHKMVFAAIGIHPNYTHEAEVGDWNRIYQWATHRQAGQKIVALGETGLDRYRDHAPFEVQLDYFDRHVRLSQQTGLPFIVHARESLPDILTLLRDARTRGPLTGVMHSFSGDAAAAAECIELDMYISFAGMLTFKKSQVLCGVAASLPVSRILVETDSPYLSPEPLRGKRNEPANVVHTAGKLAEARGESQMEIQHSTTENARRLFGLTD